LVEDERGLAFRFGITAASKARVQFPIWEQLRTMSSGWVSELGTIK